MAGRYAKRILKMPDAFAGADVRNKNFNEGLSIIPLTRRNELPPRQGRQQLDSIIPLTPSV